MISYESFETRSTKATTNDHYLYYSDTNYLKLDMRKITSRFTSVPLFQHIQISGHILLPKSIFNMVEQFIEY
ncbi:unnamed protein product, partial [Rotaria sp. Silwood1]